MIDTVLEEKALQAIDAGVIDYRKGYYLQRKLVKKRQLGQIPDTLLLVEHPPVFTIGRSGSKVNLLIGEDSLKRMGLELIETNRGGDITFHGPGQLVLYPILDLKRYKRDILWYIRGLEEVIIDFLLRYHLAGFRIPGATGIWIDNDNKIGSIGIGIAKWVTYHGLSINVNTSLYYFDMIRPCGLARARVTSLASLLKRHINIFEAKRYLIQSFERIFL